MIAPARPSLFFDKFSETKPTFCPTLISTGSLAPFLTSRRPSKHNVRKEVFMARHEASSKRTEGSPLHAEPRSRTETRVSSGSLKRSKKVKASVLHSHTEEQTVDTLSRQLTGSLSLLDDEPEEHEDDDGSDPPGDGGAKDSSDEE